MLHIETWKTNTILRTVSENIKKNELKQYTKLWKEMIKYIKNPENWWVWLAAPQVWYNKRLIIVSLLKNRDDENFPTLMMINPEILEHSSVLEKDVEWCLSVPWEKWKVARFSEIKLKYIDEKGKEKTLYLKWLSARIVQHEIDHLNWVLFTDRLNDDLLFQKEKEVVL
jgi:peptide deformylase